VIELFVGYVETIATTLIGRIDDRYVPYVLAYVMGLPLLMLILYMIALAIKPEILTGIADWGSSREYFEAMTWDRRHELKFASQDFDALKTRIRAALPLIDELVAAGEWKSAKHVARAYLHTGSYKECLGAVNRILPHLRPEQPEYYEMLGNAAYARLGLRQFDKAIKELLVIHAAGPEHFMPWHAAALAYACFLKGDHTQSTQWLQESARDPLFAARRRNYAVYYSDFAAQLFAISVPDPSEEVQAASELSS
jgi:tetratricopeptide (TPR) repeat protein